MSPPRVTIVTVSYNSAGVLGGLLASCPADVPVVVADNGSADIDATRTLVQTHGATLVESSVNLGFGAACNLGAAEARTEFIFFVNPDARLQADTLTALLATADANPDAVAFNPLLVNEVGTPAPKRKSDLIPKSEFMSREIPDHDTPIYTLNGAAVMVRHAQFDQIGGFDPGIFLFFEDDDLAARLRQSGGTLMFSPQAFVRHIGGAASAGPQLAGEAFKTWHKGYSRLYVMRKHRRPLGRMRALGMAIMRAVSPIVLISRPHRVKRLAFLRGTWAALCNTPLPTAPKDSA